MAKAFAVLLVLVALVAEALFLLTGAGGAAPRVAELAQHLGPWAGHPAIAGAGGVVFLVGTLLLGRGGPEHPYAAREALLVIVTAAAAAFTVAALIGVGREWNAPTLATLALGAMAELVVALVLCVRIATLPERRKLLFVPAVVGVVLVGTVQVLTLTLGAA